MYHLETHVRAEIDQAGVSEIPDQQLHDVIVGSRHQRRVTASNITIYKDNMSNNSCFTGLGQIVKSNQAAYGVDCIDTYELKTKSKIAICKNTMYNRPIH